MDNPVARRGNPAYADDMGVSIPGGMPDGYSLQSLASFSDSARIQGNGVAWVQFQLRVDGSFYAANNGGNAPFLQYASTQLDQRDGNQGGQWSNTAYATREIDVDRSNFSFSFPQQSVDMTVWSNPFKVINGEVNFSFWLYSTAEMSFYQNQWLDGGGLYSVTSDFGHTAQVVGARGMAADGSVVQIGEVMGVSGTMYATAAPVPEPANWALLAVGLATLAGLARSRRSKRQH